MPGAMSPESLARSKDNDPFLSFRFGVEFDKASVGGFNEVTGLQVDVEIEEYREGGLNGYVHKFAGKAKYPSNLVLKRGLMNSTMLWNWQTEVNTGQVKRKNISIILRDTEGREKYRWNFDQAFPVRWSGPSFRAGAAEVALETIEFVHCGFTKA